MNIVRRLLLGILTPVFILLLFATALDFGIISAAGNPSNVKHILADTGIYRSIIPDALAQAKTASNNQVQIPLAQKVVMDAAGQAFTPQIVQSSAENAIDGIYHWLDGKTAAPDFRIDLSQVKTNFAAAIAKAAEEQAAQLPVCATYIVPANFDPFSATCRPAALSPAQVGVLAQNAMNSGQGFLENPVITAGNLKNDQGQLIFADQLRSVPNNYQRIKKTPLILSILCLLVGAGIVFLSTSRLKGIRHLGIVLILTGVFMLIFAWALNYGVNNKALPKLTFENNAVLEKDVKILLKDITQNIDKNYWFFGSLYAVLGATAIDGAEFMKRKHSAAATSHNIHPDIPVSRPSRHQD